MMLEVQIFWHRGQVKSAVGTCTFLLCDYCILTLFSVFVVKVKVIKFNRRRPVPDAEDSDFLNTYLNNGITGSLSITGYRSVSISLLLLTSVMLQL